MVSVFIRPNSKCEPGLRSPTIKETKLLEDKQTNITTLSYLIWVAVGRGSPVLQVSASFLGHIPRDSNGATPIGHAGRKVMNGGGLVEARQSSFIVLALVGVVGFDVSNMMSRELVNSSFDFRQSAFLSHLQG